MTSLVRTSKPCSLCSSERFRTPIEVCNLGHCLDIGCLLKFLESWPSAPGGPSVLTCPTCSLNKHFSVIDLSSLTYREDIVKTQGSWVKIKGTLPGPTLKVTVATTTKWAEIAKLYTEPYSTDVSNTVSCLCLSLKMGFKIGIPRIKEISTDDLLPEDFVAKPQESGKTISIYSSILSRAFCRQCAPPIKMLDNHMNDYQYRLSRANLVTQCIEAGHLDCDIK